MVEPPPEPNPVAAEARFRGLLERAGIEQPDSVEYPGAGELLFRWEGPKVAVVVELTGDRVAALGPGPEPPV